MEKVFNLSIISPEKIIYEGEVSSLIAPAALGYLGVLANHAPLAAALISGKIILREKSGLGRTLRLEGKGFLEVLHNQATIFLNPASFTRESA